MAAVRHHQTALTRLMGAFFAVGSLCFIVGPTTTYTNWVGGQADAVTFFVGSVWFTLGGLTQCLLAFGPRGHRPEGLAGWRGAWIQSVGTVLFNAMTLAAITIGPSNARYDWSVWPLNVAGSAGFLLSGLILYRASPRRGLLPRHLRRGGWEAAVNLLGCILFGVSAGAGFVVGSGGAELSESYANWTTTLGAVCFLAGALAACGAGVTARLHGARALAGLERDIAHLVIREEERVIEIERVVVSAEQRSAGGSAPRD